VCVYTYTTHHGIVLIIFPPVLNLHSVLVYSMYFLHNKIYYYRVGQKKYAIIRFCVTCFLRSYYVTGIMILCLKLCSDAVNNYVSTLFETYVNMSYSFCLFNCPSACLSVVLSMVEINVFINETVAAGPD